MGDKIKEMSKKWWFWVIIAVVVLGIIGFIIRDPEPETNPQNNVETKQNNNEGIKYTLVGGETGEYGKKVVLNADTDLPATKYLYKIPTGTYTVTTTYEKLSEFWVVKDEVVRTGTPEYPEELNYAGGPYDLTAGDDDFGGRASKELIIKISEDESILINGSETLIFTLQE